MPVIEKKDRAGGPGPTGGAVASDHKSGRWAIVVMIGLVLCGLVGVVLVMWPAIQRLASSSESATAEPAPAAAKASAGASAAQATTAQIDASNAEAGPHRAVFECLVEVLTARTMLDQDKKNREHAVEIGADVAVFDSLVTKAEQNLSRHADLCPEILAPFQSAHRGDSRGLDDQINKIQIDMAARHPEEAALFRQTMDVSRRASPGSEIAVLKSQLLGTK